MGQSKNDLMPRKMKVDEEFEQVCSLVNSAYEVETGDSGVAFKKRKRFHEPSTQDPRLMQTLRETWVVESEGVIIGCVRVRVEDSIAHIGPIAVHRDHQGKGLGKMLLDFAESQAETSEIEVVSCRSDLFPMYHRRGYETVRKIPITDRLAPEHLTRSNLEFVIMRKESAT